MFAVVLVPPEIPPNTGNVIRLTANTATELHLVEPLGFRMDDRDLKRAGLDYHEYARVAVHRDWRRLPRRRSIARRARRCSRSPPAARASLYDTRFEPGDVLVFGCETSGLPAPIVARVRRRRRGSAIPMRPGVRSLNLSNAVAVTVYEAWRQQGFAARTPRDVADITPSSPRRCRGAADAAAARSLRARLAPQGSTAARGDSLRAARGRPPRRSACRCRDARPARAPRALRARLRRRDRGRPGSPAASCPRASARPTRRLRDRSPVQVSTRSPSPASPISVSRVPPMRREQPARLGQAARDRARRARCGRSPSPSLAPAAIASTFLTAPPTSTPAMSSDS